MSRPSKLVLAALLSVGFASTALALSVTTSNNATTLMNNVVSGSGAIDVVQGSAVYTGHSAAAGTYTDGPSGIANGIILTSGYAATAATANSSGSTGDSLGLSGDALCDDIVGDAFTTYDATKLSFDFDLAEYFDGVSIQFVFGSEEYPEWVNTNYNDVMGIYLNGEQIAFDDDGNPITINGPFFNSTNVVTSNGTTYDGSTGLLVTQAPLAGGSTDNTLEIVICDGGDHIYDSGMFVAWLNGCVGDDCTGTVPCESIDDDADGYTSCEDCDDTNPYVNPGAAEECDGVDNDCDAEVDEGDVCCDDTDGDGICDTEDNCETVANADQADGDLDGYGDVCDACPVDNPNDSDGDGVCESDDICPGGDDTVDPDGDGVPSFCDVCPDDYYDDSDGDGTCDSDDTCPGGDDSVDTDGDGTPDDCDVCPLDYYDDSDADGLCDSDDDCDGTSGGDLIDETGCSIEDYCPCDGGWKNHGQYVSCVAAATNDFVDLGLIDETEKGDIQSDAGQSSCGHKAK